MDLSPINSASLRRLPPYGHELACRPKNEIFIYTGKKAWWRAKVDAHRPRLVLPNEAQADEYKWPVEGCDCLVFADIPREALLRLARQLLFDGANIVRAVNQDGSVNVFSRCES